MTDAQFDAILADLRLHGNLSESLRKANVHRARFYERVEASPEDADRYARAKAEGYQVWADQILEIADAREGDVMVDEDGRRIIDNEAVQRARLRVDSRKWLLSKLVPKVYGEKLLVGGDPENPIPPLLVLGGPRGGESKG